MLSPFSFLLVLPATTASSILVVIVIVHFNCRTERLLTLPDHAEEARIERIHSVSATLSAASFFCASCFASGVKRGLASISPGSSFPRRWKLGAADAVLVVRLCPPGDGTGDGILLCRLDGRELPVTAANGLGP